jgi:dipeptidyl-peptidase 4
MSTYLRFFAAGTILVPAFLVSAQGTRTDYARAEQLLGWNAGELVTDDAVRPRWMNGDRFWFRNRGANGYEFVIMDLATGARRPAFDHARLASALSVAADTAYDAGKLPFRDLAWVQNEQAVRFSVGRKKAWTCNVTTYACVGPDTLPVEKPSEVRSPDGQWVAYERAGNIYIRPAAGGAEVGLTSDGTPEYGYGLNNIGCCQQVTNVRNSAELRPFVLWSPDSKKLVTHKWDQRNVRWMHLLETKNPGPVLHSYRYALPGDSIIPKWELYVVDVGARQAREPATGGCDQYELLLVNDGHRLEGCALVGERPALLLGGQTVV